MVSFNGVSGSGNVQGPKEPSRGQIPESIASRVINPDAPLPHSNSAAAMARMHQAEEPTILVTDVKGFFNRLAAKMQAETIIQRTSGGNPDLKAVMSNVFYGTAI